MDTNEIQVENINIHDATMGSTVWPVHSDDTTVGVTLYSIRYSFQQVRKDKRVIKTYNGHDDFFSRRLSGEPL